jgi:putative peptidoglycan lipid II flippase
MEKPPPPLVSPGSSPSASDNPFVPGARLAPAASDLEDDPVDFTPESTALTAQAGVVGAFTFLSRILGLIRDGAIAYALGTRAAADAFYVAFRIPNLLRRMLAEGNLTLSFVPVFTESMHRSKREAREVVDVTFTLMSLFLILLSVAGVLGAAFFVRFTALGFSEDPEKFALTVYLTRITFPYILLVSLAALAMGILNARKHFAVPAFAPSLMNLGMILGALYFSRFFAKPAEGVAWGVLLGGVLQLVVQVPLLIRYGFFPRVNFNFRHPAVKKILRLMGPTIYGSAVYQINVLAITFMASFLPTGSVSYLWYADRVVEFPLGIFAISLATVALPLLSDHAARKDYALMKETLAKVLSMVWLLNIPAAVALFILAEPILAVLFYRGGFTQASNVSTAQALRFFALGLPFVSAARITSSAFYAVQDAKKPVIAANLAVLANIAVGAALLHPLQHRGLALGVSIGSLINFLLLMFFYRKKVGPIGLRAILQDTLKILIAAAAMGAVLYFILSRWNLSYAPFFPRLGFLAVLIGVGLAVYLSAALALKIQGLRPLQQGLMRKFRISKRPSKG